MRIEQVGSTSQTVCFVNAARAVAHTPITPGAGLIEVAVAEPPSNRDPMVHHRFTGGIANIVFLDGHVEARPDKTCNPPARPTRPMSSSSATRINSSISARPTNCGTGTDITFHSVSPLQFQLIALTTEYGY